MRTKMKIIAVSQDIYDGLNELRKKYHCTFGQAIEKHIPMPFFESTINNLPPVKRITVSKAIPLKKKKYSYAADLKDFMDNRCKSLNLMPMKPPSKKQVLKAEYDERTQAHIDEIESKQPWMKKYRKTREESP